MTLESDAKFEEKLACYLETNRNFANFHQSAWNVKIGALIRSLCPKQKMYELQIYSGVGCHDNEEWHKNSRGTNLSI